ncbi:hypothetical protein FA95DRAFT_1505941, partial [Auriscalpium vulgare]
YGVYLNRKVTLEKLYRYEPDAIVEYPETSSSGYIGHLFRTDAASSTPWLDFVYSLGPPKGRSSSNKPVYVPLLRDRSGRTVPCRKLHATCQGCKICPYLAEDIRQSGHTAASREELRARLEEDAYILQRESATPARQVREKTLAQYSAYVKLGCPAPLFEASSSLAGSLDSQELEAVRAERRRGFEEAAAKCEGQLIFECEHYNSLMNRHHFLDYTVSRGSLDIDYLEALFHNDFHVIEAIEADSEATDLATDVGGCRTVVNCSSQRVHCPRDHRREDSGRILPVEMIALACASRFQMYEPMPEYQSVCPYTLVVCSGRHGHPIPLPVKTPPSIRHEITSLLNSMGNDLAEATPRKFLRHPSIQAYLRQRLPSSYIRQAKAAAFPLGTGWKGLAHLMKEQSIAHSAAAQYIRYMDEIPLTSLAHWDASQTSDGTAGDSLRIIVCMEPEQSSRLLNAQYLQSDIAFRRVPDFYEFELGGWDRMNKTALVYCRVFLTSQSAAAHFHLFQKLEEIVQGDTNRHLLWRHVHSTSLHNPTGILHWAADQHGGQAKGLGLHLCAVARAVEDRPDFHEPERLLSELTEYDHLQRFYRLCSVHVYRNIKTCAVSDLVKQRMRSLVCIQHDDWDGALEFIEREGGRAGNAWLQDKVRSHFAFPGMCWKKSHIPLDVWRAGDRNSNLIEAAHADVNREGTGCTLVSGVGHAHRFDSFKLKTLRANEITGVRGTFQTGAPSELSLRNLRRQRA